APSILDYVSTGPSGRSALESQLKNASDPHLGVGRARRIHSVEVLISVARVREAGHDDCPINGDDSRGLALIVTVKLCECFQVEVDRDDHLIAESIHVVRRSGSVVVIFDHFGIRNIRLSHSYLPFGSILSPGATGAGEVLASTCFHTEGMAV